MKIYIAGPYTQGDVAQNVFNAIKVADVLVAMGHTPYIPHLTHFWHLVSPKEWSFWIKYDSQFLPLCDCLFRLEGASKGADSEVHQATVLGLPVYYSLEELKDDSMVLS